MFTEEGIITSTSETMAWVKTVRSKACESCDACGSCESTDTGKGMIVQVSNTINAYEGDRVVIGFKTAPSLKLTFMLYIFPIILLIAGAATGQSLAPRFGTDPSITSLLGGLICFAVAFTIIRMTSNRLSKSQEFKPFLIRIARRIDS